MNNLSSFLISLLVMACDVPAQHTEASSSGSWPQWRGPDRSNKSSETGLLKEWPTNGPPLLWTVTGLGEGITAMAVAGGKAYTLGYRDGSEFVFALNEVSGETRWVSAIGRAKANTGFNSVMRWLSPRVPTVDGDRIYTVTADGDLTCLRTVDGTTVWRKSYPADFQSQGRNWGYCDYPLVDGENLICVPGGLEAKVVALNKRSGELVWQALRPGPEYSHYAAPVISTAAGIRQCVVFLQTNLIGIAANDGRVLWRYNRTAARTANSYTPIVQGDFVFSANGYGGGMALFKLVRDGDSVSVVEQYHRRFNFNSFQDNTVLVDDHVYAFQGAGQAVCIELKTGNLAWGPIGTDTRRRAAITYADGHLYVRRSDGSVTLVEATPREYVEKASFQIPDLEEVSGVTFPVIAGGRLYLRDNNRLLCYDVRRDALSRPRVPPQQLAVALRTKAAALQQASAPPTAGTERELDAIYVPTPSDVIDKMLEVASLTTNSVLYDLGSGDGRILFAAAQKHGCRAVGYELDPRLVQEARDSARTNGLDRLVRIEQQHLFTADLSGADVIVVYLPTDLLQRLRPQFEKLKPGARIVSHQFQIPGLAPPSSLELVSKQSGDRHRVFVWTAPLEQRNSTRAAKEPARKAVADADSIDVREVGFKTPECVLP